MRPHLGFWLSRGLDRLYVNPELSMTVEEYIAGWAGPDGEKMGGHDVGAVREEPWPWLGRTQLRQKKRLFPEAF